MKMYLMSMWAAGKIFSSEIFELIIDLNRVNFCTFIETGSNTQRRITRKCPYLENPARP